MARKRGTGRYLKSKPFNQSFRIRVTPERRCSLAREPLFHQFSAMRTLTDFSGNGGCTSLYMRHVRMSRFQTQFSPYDENEMNASSFPVFIPGGEPFSRSLCPCVLFCWPCVSVAWPWLVLQFYQMKLWHGSALYLHVFSGSHFQVPSSRRYPSALFAQFPVSPFPGACVFPPPHLTGFVRLIGSHTTRFSCTPIQLEYTSTCFGFCSEFFRNSV